ncbi:MAG TPA: hypothetical protein DCQ31_10490 [Bacteroidales bacterium]|nr:hypothetical protein [Bacteroidales bacterium]
MKQAALIFILIGMLNAFTAKAQVEETQVKSKHAVGIAAGTSTGYGLSYRYIPDRFGFQVAFAPMVSDDRTLTSFGFTFIHKIIEKPKSSLYLYQGNHWMYSNEKWARISKSYAYINGLGVGIEFIINKSISYNVMGGFASYRNSYSDSKTLSLSGETGLFYKF